MQLPRGVLFLGGVVSICRVLAAADVAVIPDLTNYNAGNTVRMRLQPGGSLQVAIRYAGESSPLANALPVNGSEYQDVWKVPDDAKTGRYLVDVLLPNGQRHMAATSFAVHRTSAKIMSVELDKTFYTTGDTVNPRIVVRNISDRRLDNLQVEFEPYNYPWIAARGERSTAWKHIVASPLSLGPGEQREFHATNAAVLQVGNRPEAVYFSVVIRDAKDQDRIYDLAFALPAFTRPANTYGPKQYPFLYLYPRESDVRKSETYRQFYPPAFVSDAITFDTRHTMFPSDKPIVVPYEVKRGNSPAWNGARIRERLVDANGKEVANKLSGSGAIEKHSFDVKGLPPGAYTMEVSVEAKDGVAFEHNQLELAVNKLPESILIFCPHQDDDASHPGIVRAAAENHIPIHFVYFTGGDAGGCDRYYMHSCDAARAMDFGENRMEESEASLSHVGIGPENLFFLGLPDGGLEQIWRHESSDAPYLSVLLASDHTPYRNAAIPNMPYARDAAIAATKDYILRFKPALIITAHPDEGHVDHRTSGWFVIEAMQELLAEGKISRDTQLSVDVFYGAVRGAKHAPFHYEKEKLFVSGEAARINQEALWYYQSQDGNHQQAEIVDFAHLPRTEAWPHFRVVDWAEHQGWNK